MLKVSPPHTHIDIAATLPAINTTNYPPVRIFEIDLAASLPILSAANEQTGQIYSRAWCLIRLHSQPLGVVELDFVSNTLTPAQYLPSIWNALHTQINEHLNTDGLPTISELTTHNLTTISTPACILAREQFLASAPFVSIVVPTHDRPDRLATCLRSLLALHYPHYEIIIADNNPSTSETLDIVQQAQKDAPHLHYLREDQPGAARARNSGMQAAKGAIIAFTDDDVIVDAHWLTEMVRAFSSADDVHCTTGTIMPLELETPAQCLFERYGAFPRIFKQRIFNMQNHHPKTSLFPFVAGSFGAGASMAFTASFIRHLGGFDLTLGGNGPSSYGEDIDAFFNVIIQGHTLVYNPAAIVYHQHRRTIEGLRKQIYTYGVGFTAYLTKNLYQRPSLAFRLVANIPLGLFRLLQARSNAKNDQLTQKMQFPKELTRLELKGMLYGPFAYIQTRQRMRKKKSASLTWHKFLGL